MHRIMRVLYFPQRFHHVVAEGGTGGAGGAAGDNEAALLEGADVERALEAVGLVLHADMREQHYAGAEH